MSEELTKTLLEFLKYPEGSSYVTYGKTTITVSVVGPFEPKASKCVFDRATVDLTFRRKTGSITVKDKMLENLMQSTCENVLCVENYPRTSIVVTVQEIESGRNLLSSCLNASCLAMINSGIAMRYLFAAIDCAITENNELIVSPNDLQIKSAIAYFTMVFSNSENKELLTSHITGEFTQGMYLRCVEKSREACTTVFENYKNLIRNKLIL